MKKRIGGLLVAIAVSLAAEKGLLSRKAAVWRRRCRLLYLLYSRTIRTEL